MAYEYTTKKIRDDKFAAVVVDTKEKRVVSYHDRFTTRSKAYTYAKQMAVRLATINHDIYNAAKAI